MAAIASAPPWNAEDDLLLKSAVEAGASLEALAKGAVRFSRKFSVRELQERWHSLLYDNDVSAQASAQMTEFELSNPNVSFKPTKLGVSKFCGKISPAKRKAESIRGLYHDMRKKLCSFNTFDLSFIEEPNAQDENMNIGGGDELLDGNYVVGDRVEDYFGFSEGGQNEEVFTDTDRLLLDNQEDVDRKPNVSDHSLLRSGDGLVEFQNCSTADELGTSHVLQDMPIWTTMEDISVPEMPIDVKALNSEETLVHEGDKDEGDVDHSRLVSGVGFPDCEMNRSNSLSGDDFADISDSLLNFANENENPAMEVDGNNKSLQSSPPKDEHEDEERNAVPQETSDPKTLHAVSEEANNTEKNDNPNQDVTPSEADPPSVKTLPDNPSSPEFYHEIMECTLNTEDPEIPCNDEPGVTESSDDPALSLANEKNISQESVSSKKEVNPAASQILAKRTVPKTNPSLSLIGYAVKPEPSDGNGLAPISQLVNNVLIDGSQSRSVVSPKISANHKLKQQGMKAPVKISEERALVVTRELGAADTDYMEQEANPLYQDKSEEEPDSYHDIPYFSDIENMILEMDLSPDDEESCFKNKVSRYQHEDAKRKIVKLEQCSRSSMQRAIASKGAFAVLYGRHLKKYIKKTEVILGRATEDNEVDIDLGEEGRANKISRRQAVLKLEGNGSFFLKNIGKSSIFLNGKEVTTGHRMCLSSSNLIEITGMSFVFEMNHKSIRRYLANAGPNGKEKYSKLEWSLPRGN